MQSEQINEIAAALAKAQGEMKNPVRNKTVTVTTKAGGSYKFSYATLDECTNCVRGPLSKNNIGLVNHLELQDDGKTRLITKLVHSSGQFLGTSRPLFVTEQTSQALMSAETYARRGNLCDLTGISAEDDDDGNAADGNVAKVQDRKPTIQPPNPTAAALVHAAMMQEAQNKPQPIPPADSGEPRKIPVGDDWIVFGQRMIALANDERWADWDEANRTNIARMENEAPKVHARMIAAIKKAQEGTPPKKRGRPPKAKAPTLRDDPEFYLKWLEKACQEASDYHAFVSSQADIIAAGLPPDQMAANDIIKKHAPQ